MTVGHSEALRAHLCRVESRAITKFTTSVTNAWTSWLLHALVDLLLGIQVELSAMLITIIHAISSSTS